MQYLKNILSLVVFFTVNINGFIQAQNLYDLEHSLIFAHFLYSSKQYEYAASEFERIVFLAPRNDSIKLKLIESYKGAGKFNIALSRMDNFYPQKVNMPAKLAGMYANLLISSYQEKEAANFLIENQSLDSITKNNYMLALLMLDKNWKQALNFTESCNVSNTKLLNISNDLKSIKYKKPGLAAFMSGVIPGSGKIYAKRGKDGFIAMFLVLVNSWQAWRGFNKNGAESLYGWAFGTMAAGFYLGNIYGSYKAAKIYNEKIDESYYNKCKAVFDSEF